MGDLNHVVCHVAVVGCGIGGLAAAIALRRQGHDVTMLEQAAQLSEVNASVLTSSFSWKTLKEKLPLSRLAPAFKSRRIPLVS